MRKAMWPRLKLKIGAQAGFAMLDSLMALVLVGSAGATYLGGLAMTSRAKMVADQQGTAGSLGQTQLEYVKTSAYVPSATTYAAGPIPSQPDYTGYSVNIAAAPANGSEDGIQRITVTVSRGGTVLDTFVGYKVNR